MLREHLSGTQLASQIHQPLRIAWFDWGMALLSAWFLGGLYLDGWAHSHGKVDNTFFTPWHAVFYSGFGAVALLLAAGVVRGILAGRNLREALPPGYEYALVGAPLFALGGVGDLIWHSVFGIESGIDALLSPTHLLLAAGMALILSAPARAGVGGHTLTLPTLLSLAFTYSLITFMTQYGHPYVYLLANTGYADADQALGVLAMMLQSAILVGVILRALRHWRLPFGALTLLIGSNAAFMSVIEDRYWVIGVALVAGILADGLVWLLKPSPSRMWAMRLCAAATPMLVYLMYFLSLMQIERVVWSIHGWLGSVIMVGFVGFGMSLLICQDQNG